MEVLPDIVGLVGEAGSAPQVVFCGMAGAESMRSREHYYETPGNEFWLCLHESGMLGTTPRLGPEDDVRLPEHGLALTDLVRHRATEGAPEWFELDALAEKVRAWEPEWLALTSKTVAHVVARHLGHRRPGLGPAGWDLAGAPVFVLPGTSGANRRRDYDGRPTRLEWWGDLAQLCGRSRPA